MPRIIWNDDEYEHLYFIKEELLKCNFFYCVVAFANIKAFNKIKSSLEKKLNSKNFEAKFIIGLSNHFTDDKILYSLFKLSIKFKNLTLYLVPPKYACFHPKVYYFKNPQGNIAIIGSANLTLGGFGDNWECSAVVKGEAASDVIHKLDELISLRFAKIATEEAIHKYKAEREKIKIARAYANKKKKDFIANKNNKTPSNIS